MTYHYKTRIQLTLNTGDRAGYMHDKAHAEQQERGVRQTRCGTTAI